VGQSLLFHGNSSDTRAAVDEADVADPASLRSIVVLLRMAHYFEAMKVKREQYFALIGDVSYAEAISASNERFASMLSAHTHGLCRQMFWSLLKACGDDQERRDIFAERSNHSVKVGIASMIARGHRKK
jgi:hypothetical protein